MNYNSETKFLGRFSSENIKKVLIDNLRVCDSFRFSVSFIMDSGLELLYSEIRDALVRGSYGEIITTDYMRITDTNVLNKLLVLMNEFPNNFKAYFLETKSTDYSSFHTKGYIFVKNNIASIIIGSSNMSKTALSREGGEWSLFSKTYTDFNLFKEVDNEFLQNINAINKPLTQEQIDAYSFRSLNVEFGNVSPNYMQKEALEALNKVRIDSHKDKAMIVAAMGSGKTFLSAFDAKNMGAKRILYVCHNESILRRARFEYERVFGAYRSYGFFVGETKNNKADVIFATNTSLSRHLASFQPYDFEYIIIDEAHHGPASTYLKIINYFKPNFLLGMTGTPDRSDQLSAKGVFDNTIPYELKMKDAIANHLIMPFKYYSVFDNKLNYDKSFDEGNLLALMVSPEHGKFIDQNIKMHLHEINGKLKCLAFCINVEHAKNLTLLMKSFGYVCDYVYGGTNSELRSNYIANFKTKKNHFRYFFRSML